MRIYSATGATVIVEVEQPNVEMCSDFDGQINVGQYLKFMWNGEYTEVRVWFPDGHDGGKMARCNKQMTPLDCLKWCRERDIGNEQGNDN